MAKLFKQLRINSLPHVQAEIKRCVDTAKDLVFIPFDDQFLIYDQDKQKQKPGDVKCGSVHCGFLKVKWLYRDPSTQKISLKLVVVLTKFTNPENKNYTRVD